MIVINILLIIICIILTLLILILFVPFRYKVHAESFDEKYMRFKVYWLLGLVGFTGEYVLGEGFKGSINLFGFAIAIKNKEDSKKEKVKKAKKENKDKKKRKNRLSEVTKEGGLNILQNIKRTLKHVLPNKVEGKARFGLDDPYDTSIICSIVEATRGMKLHDLDLEYVFDQEVYEGMIDIEGRIFCIYFVYIIVRLYLDRSTKKIIFN